MPDLTPRNDIKKQISEILKRVDQLLKAHELDEAVRQIEKAKGIDPKNVYVFAYEERLTAMREELRQTEEIDAKRRSEEAERKKEEEERKRVEEEVRKAEEEKRKAEESRRKAEEDRRKAAEEEAQHEEEEKRRAEEERRRAVEEKRRGEERELREEEDERRKVDELRKRASQREEAVTVARKKTPLSIDSLEDTKRRILEERKKRGTSAHPESAEHRGAYEEGLDIYRRVLLEVWADGAATKSEEEQLSGLRGSLSIEPGDHNRLEREAKLDSYKQAFRRAWSSGAISPESASSLAELRKKFRISLEDHEQIEANLLWELRSSSQKAKILFIDDDKKLLKAVSDTLQDEGFETIAVETTDEAFRYLKDHIPDLILSDINLESSTIGGFTFYERVREMDRLHEIPFIFLSGLTDEVLIRTGKELGVDDYLTKPFSDETLLAIIKGKLKRYRQLRKPRAKK